MAAAVVKTYREVEQRKQTDLLLRHIMTFLAETLEKAMAAFGEMKQKGLSPKIDMVSRREAKDKEGEYIPVDCPLRAGLPSLFHLDN